MSSADSAASNSDGVHVGVGDGLAGAASVVVGLEGAGAAGAHADRASDTAKPTASTRSFTAAMAE